MFSVVENVKNAAKNSLCANLWKQNSHIKSYILLIFFGANLEVKQMCYKLSVFQVYWGWNVMQ